MPGIQKKKKKRKQHFNNNKQFQIPKRLPPGSSTSQSQNVVSQPTSTKSNKNQKVYHSWTTSLAAVSRLISPSLQNKQFKAPKLTNKVVSNTEKPSINPSTPPFIPASNYVPDSKTAASILLLFGKTAYPKVPSVPIQESSSMASSEQMASSEPTASAVAISPPNLVSEMNASNDDVGFSNDDFGDDDFGDDDGGNDDDGEVVENPEDRSSTSETASSSSSSFSSTTSVSSSSSSSSSTTNTSRGIKQSLARELALKPYYIFQIKGKNSVAMILKSSQLHQCVYRHNCNQELNNNSIGFSYRTNCLSTIDEKLNEFFYVTFKVPKSLEQDNWARSIMCMTLQCKGIALGRSNSNENNIGSCLDYQSIPEDIDKVDVSQLNKIDAAAQLNLLKQYRTDKKVGVNVGTRSAVLEIIKDRNINNLNRNSPVKNFKI